MSRHHHQDQDDRIDHVIAPERLTYLQRLLLTCASSPTARSLAGERRSEGGLRAIAKRRRHRGDRCVSVARHLNGLLEPVVAQPGVRCSPVFTLKARQKRKRDRKMLASKNDSEFDEAA